MEKIEEEMRKSAKTPIKKLRKMSKFIESKLIPDAVAEKNYELVAALISTLNDLNQCVELISLSELPKELMGMIEGAFGFHCGCNEGCEECPVESAEVEIKVSTVPEPKDQK